jgi:hypothetical protein
MINSVNLINYIMNENVGSNSICKKHSKPIIVMCLIANCCNDRLCSICFEEHEPSHVKLFRHLEDLSVLNLKEMTKKLDENNYLKNSKLISLKDKSRENVHALTQKLGEKFSSYYYKRFMGILNLKFNKFEESVNSWEKYYEENVVQIKKGEDTYKKRGNNLILLENQLKTIETSNSIFIDEIKIAEKDFYNLNQKIFQILEKEEEEIEKNPINLNKDEILFKNIIENNKKSEISQETTKKHDEKNENHKSFPSRTDINRPQEKTNIIIEILSLLWAFIYYSIIVSGIFFIGMNIVDARDSIIINKRR